MKYVFLFALLSTCVLAESQPDGYSYSTAVGKPSGTSFSLSGDGRITAIRFWEQSSGPIYGIELRFGDEWESIGNKYGSPLEMELREGETINHITGKYSYFYIQSVTIHTNKARALTAGQPYGTSFMMTPENEMAELRIFSGTYSTYIQSLGAHWACYQATNTSANST